MSRFLASHAPQSITRGPLARYIPIKARKAFSLSAAREEAATRHRSNTFVLLMLPLRSSLRLPYGTVDIMRMPRDVIAATARLGVSGTSAITSEASVSPPAGIGSP